MSSMTAAVDRHYLPNTDRYYRWGGSRRWEPVPARERDLSGFAEDLLRSREFQDFDGGAIESIEFWIAGERLFAAARFDGPDGYDAYGAMSEFRLGSLEEIRRVFGQQSVSPHPFGPDRDWLICFEGQGRKTSEDS